MVKTMGAIFRGWTDGERTDRGEERREGGWGIGARKTDSLHARLFTTTPLSLRGGILPSLTH